MLVRAALPVLLLALFALPAHADVAFPHPCDRSSKKKEGDPCGNGSGTCRKVKCMKEVGDEGDIYEYDCIRCMSREGYQQHNREYAEYKRQTYLRWGPWALAASCLISLTWYQLRRKHLRSSKGNGPSSSEPPAPPTA